MPRWKALPEELDPQVREFTGQLRRLIDRNGLSVAAVADSTGFSKTSWERYLNGRLLPPLRAVLALAEQTGAHPSHLTTLWELAERAWSRAEMRQDVTMEAIRVAQARAALGELDPEPAGAEPPATGARSEKAGKFGKAEKGGTPGEPGPAPLSQLPSSADFPQWGSAAPAADVTPAEGKTGRRGGRYRTPMIVAGAAGAVLVAVAAVLLLNPGAEATKKAAAPKPQAAPQPNVQPALPDGVRCTGDDCAGKDPEKMGCGGRHAVTPSRGMAGRMLIEVRYSSVCHTAWARLSRAAQGDQATISAGGHRATARAERAGDAYTMMVAVSGDPAKVAACGTTVAGVKGCSRPLPATAAGVTAPSGAPSGTAG
ncbi:Helix-turn-helix domain-containing protein [Streptomyces sp. 2323.1]|uniref:helix-turn-helix domain-containing protein n=1 Tax=Streptomyces sp. 2323.1 TaxID=1938841 RepID=UPI000BB836B0|nr:XRE family transcriptional regulator [Streptomyces sp. 2323.1]SOE11693.1 Helix-turn-helix domain-containing protein [Streptomyces sp. 2323.1]